MVPIFGVPDERNIPEIHDTFPLQRRAALIAEFPGQLADYSAYVLSKSSGFPTSASPPYMRDDYM